MPGMSRQAAQEGSVVGDVRGHRHRRVRAPSPCPRGGDHASHCARRVGEPRCSIRRGAEHESDARCHGEARRRGRLRAQGGARRAPHAQPLRRKAAGRATHRGRADGAGVHAHRSRTGLSVAGPQHTDPVVGRIAAAAARYAIVVPAVRRGLCARRAIGRAASSRRRGAVAGVATIEGGRQLAVRGRA
ncbi:hypothetical protein D3C86_1500840 [compost metagenome]